jgi:hypothetical protein
MDEKILLPILGVAVGWLLNTVSNYSKFRLEYKVHSGKALAYLMVVLDQLAVINRSLENWKDHVISWKEFEKLREHKMGKHFLATEELSQTVEKAFLELAGYDPIFANHLLSIKNALAFHRTIKMSEIVKDQKAYVDTLSSWETAMIVYEKMLEKDTLRLARQHGLLTWVKLKKRMYRHNKASSSSGVFDGLYENYKAFRGESEAETSNKGVVQDAAKAAAPHTP